MTNEDQIKYLRNSILTMMVRIEDKTGQLFHESHPELESSFWFLVDANNLSGLKLKHNEFCKIVDSLEME